MDPLPSRPIDASSNEGKRGVQARKASNRGNKQKQISRVLAPIARARPMRDFSIGGAGGGRVVSDTDTRWLLGVLLMLPAQISLLAVT